MLFRKFAGAVCAAAIALGAAGAAQAETVWRFGTAAQPGSVLFDVIQKFVADFNSAFEKDEMKMEYQFIGNEQEMMQQLIRGRVHIGGTSFAGSAVAIPENIVTTVPYLWSSDDERIFVMDNHVIPVLKDIALAKGVVLVDWGDVGWNDVICNFECRTPDQVKGQKARMSPVSRNFWEAVGANGVQMPLSEFFPGLQSGLVRAGDLPFLYYVTTPAAQSAPHYVMTRHYHHPSVWIMNKALHDKQPAALKERIEKAIPDVAWSRKQVADTEKPKMEEFRKKGGFVHELTAEQREAWAKVARPGQAELITSIGGRAQELYDTLLKGKKEWAEKHEKK